MRTAKCTTFYRFFTASKQNRSSTLVTWGVATTSSPMAFRFPDLKRRESGIVVVVVVVLVVVVVAAAVAAAAAAAVVSQRGSR